MVNKYTVILFVLLGFGNLCASDGPSFATPFLGLEGDELRLRAHQFVEMSFQVSISVAPMLVARLDEQKFSVDFDDLIVHRKMGLLLSWHTNPDLNDAAYREAALASGCDVEAQGALRAFEFRYWFIHKMLWDVTRPAYENFHKTELIKWALFPYIYWMIFEGNEESTAAARRLFSEFYFVTGILPNDECYDQVITAMMEYLAAWYVRARSIFNTISPDPETLFVPLGMLIEVVLCGEEIQIFVCSRETYHDSENPLPGWASVLVREGGAGVRFYPGHNVGHAFDNEQSADSGGGSAGSFNNS
jgi:hypothetical protein